MSDYYQFRDEKGTPIDYYQLVNDNNELCEEIERLRIIEEKYKDSQLYIQDFKEEIERLHSIIKEVREYIENYNIGMPYDHFVKKENLLEILDKEKENA